MPFFDTQAFRNTMGYDRSPVSDQDLERQKETENQIRRQRLQSMMEGAPPQTLDPSTATPSVPGTVNPVPVQSIPDSQSTQQLSFPMEGNTSQSLSFPMVQREQPSYGVPQSGQNLRNMIGQEPLHADYKPSLFRNIMSRVSGVAAGLGSGGAKAAGETYNRVKDQPYTDQLTNYQQRLKQASDLYGMDVSQNAAALNAEKVRAEAEHLGYQGQAEQERAGAERARRIQEEKKTSLMADTHAQQVQEEKDLEAIKHPEKENKDWQLKLGSDGSAYKFNNASGDWERINDPREAIDKLTNDLSRLSKAYEIVADPLAKQSDKSAAKTYIDEYKQKNDAKPPQVLMFAPADEQGNRKAIVAKPGTVLPAGTQNASGVNAENTLTTATRTMHEAAPTVISFADKLTKMVNEQKAALGPAASRWSEFMAGKVGAENKEFTKLRTDTRLLQTVLMRMHIGARGGDHMMQHFQNLIDESKQDPENMLSALEEIKAYAQEIQKQGASGTKSETTETKSLTADEAKSYLQKANGDKEKARALAKADGKVF